MNNGRNRLSEDSKAGATAKVQAALFAALLASCATVTTSTKVPLGAPNVEQPPRAADVTIQSSAQRSHYLQEAFDEVASILADPEFAQQIAALPVQTLATTADDGCSVVSPVEVLRDIQNLSGITIRSRPSSLHWFSNAGTSSCGEVAINTCRVDLWDKGTTDTKAELINTLAHELTHLVPRGACSKQHTNYGLYLDGGHTSCANGSACSDAFLVSYVWGDLVECAYRVRKKEPKGIDFRACVMGTVNGYKMDRTTMRPDFGSVEGPSACKSISVWK